MHNVIVALMSTINALYLNQPENTHLPLSITGICKKKKNVFLVPNALATVDLRDQSWEADVYFVFARLWRFTQQKKGSENKENVSGIPQS